MDFFLTTMKEQYISTDYRPPTSPSPALTHWPPAGRLFLWGNSEVLQPGARSKLRQHTFSSVSCSHLHLHWITVYQTVPTTVYDNCGKHHMTAVYVYMCKNCLSDSTLGGCMAHGLRLVQMPFSKLRAGSPVPLRDGWLLSHYYVINAWLVEGCTDGLTLDFIHNVHWTLGYLSNARRPWLLSLPR